ncbi:hypothetical protein E4U53_001493 [Claviceps sorghi]|nr:hypothetical protein E4U53_001493 [Claviceps sorghi]
MFKAAHIILAAVALAAVYQVWVWICVGIWAADYIVRFLRIIWINVIRRSAADAIASFDQDANIIRLRVSAPSGVSRQTPGQYYFVSVVGWHFWQNHPFTVAGRSDGVANTTSPVKAIEKEYAGNASPTGAAAPDVESLSDRPNMTFMIRPRSGMTRRLRELLCKNGGSGPQKLKLVLEGPYGTAANVERYQRLLFIAGGTGITAVMPYIRGLLEDDPGRRGRPTVRLVWAAPQEKFIRLVVEQHLGSLQRTCSLEKLELDFYVTSSKVGAEKSHDLQCKYARPDIDALVQQFVQQTADGIAGVFVCGPGRMADDARKAVVRHAKATSGHVDLFEETYEW